MLTPERRLTSTALRLLAAAVLLSSGLPAAAQVREPQRPLTLKLCIADIAFPPLTAPDGSGTLQVGLRRLADELSIRVDNLMAPRRRCVEELRNGLVDAIFTAYSEERAGMMRFPMQGNQPDAAQSMVEQALLIYRRKGEPVDWDSMRFHGLDNGAIGVMRGFEYGHALAVLGVPVDDGAVTGEQLLRKLMAGHVAVAIMNPTEAEVLVQRLFPGRVEALAEPFHLYPVYLAIRPAFYAAHAAAVDRLWQAIGRERARDGTAGRALRR